MDATKDGSSMNYDDAALERALSALPLEETPPDLHARILSAVAHRPEPAFRAWEMWLVGAAVAVCTWLILAIIGTPSESLRIMTQHVEAAIIMIVTPPAVYYLALGVLTAFALPRITGSRLLSSS
jgi:hypothetical protein